MAGLQELAGNLFIKHEQFWLQNNNNNNTGAKKLHKPVDDIAVAASIVYVKPMLCSAKSIVALRAMFPIDNLTREHR